MSRDNGELIAQRIVRQGVIVVLFSVSACRDTGPTTPPPPPTLTVSLSANPSSGQAPLSGVDLTASVGGTATGTVRYRFDCTGDGTFDVDISSAQATYTAANSCAYPVAGTYTARVSAEREDVAAANTAQIVVTAAPPPPTLAVTLTASPSSGQAPLSGVDLTASVGGTATGTIRYRFDCTGDGTFDVDVTSSQTAHTAVDACSYSETGTFTAKVRAERQSLVAENTAQIIVTAAPPPPTLSVELTVVPASGLAPLLDVDVIASVGGTAAGDIIYRIDCIAGGTLDLEVTSPQTTLTATDLCNYPTAGSFIAHVSVYRGQWAWDTVHVTVEQPTLSASASLDPATGTAPLMGVDFTGSVSGTASGDIRYRFDCHYYGPYDIGYDVDVTSSQTAYTAADACSYQAAGTYLVRVRVERQGLMAEATSRIVVSVPPIPEFGTRVMLCGWELNWDYDKDFYQEYSCFANGSTVPSSKRLDLITDARLDRSINGRFAALHAVTTPVGTTYDGWLWTNSLLYDDFMGGPDPLPNETLRIDEVVNFAERAEGKSFLLEGALFTSTNRFAVNTTCIGMNSAADCPYTASDAGGTITVELEVRDSNGNVIPDSGTVAFNANQWYTAHVRVSSTRGLRAIYYVQDRPACTNLSGGRGCQGRAKVFGYGQAYTPGTIESLDIGVLPFDTNRMVFEARADDGVNVVVKRVRVYVQR